MPGRGMAAHAAPAQAPAVGQRVLDAVHTPPFVIQHTVVDHAANGELWVLLDRVVLEVLVATVAVGEPTPGRIASPDPSQERQAHGRALDVERLVVLDHLDRLAGVEGGGGGGGLLPP